MQSPDKSADLSQIEELKSAGRVPAHVAIIMDGNGRWAKARHLPRVEGHRNGAKAVRSVVEESRRLGIRYLTLFSFSTENWLRPEQEVSALMGLFCQYLEREADLLEKNGIRLQAIGALERLPAKALKLLDSVRERTSTLNGMDLILALSYGGRDELVQAARNIAVQVKAGKLDPESIDSNLVRRNLYAPDIPDPDLLIRTSSECRISNFLLWQLAYSEIVISPELWPDFSKEEYQRCLIEFCGRKRRFGLTAEQVEGLKDG
jgi:undecaprenyl diphosphate synthase